VITSYEPEFQTGTVITGKWNKGQYIVERLLGEGANGKVFLVRKGKMPYALKLGFDVIDHQSEVNALKALSKSSSSFSAYLHDVDDCVVDGNELPFCVMRYIKGQPLPEFLYQNGFDWMYVIGLNLLKKLSELHTRGYAFGDLKTDNMIVSQHGEVELVDFGGVTYKGRAVKQFTEAFDRGFWAAGSRNADDGYDLFAFAVVMIAAADSTNRLGTFKQILPQNRSVDYLLDMVNGNKRLAKAAPFLRKALKGEYRSSKEAVSEWRRHIWRRMPSMSDGSPRNWLKICFAASVILFASTLYFYWS
jgi:serine/threonine protein kinase